MFKKKIIYLLLIILIITSITYTLINKNKNYSKIEKVIYNFTNSIKDILIPDITNYNYDLIDGLNKEILYENNELKELLELDKEEYNLLHAKVIDRDISWYQELTINKGELDGIKVDMAVTSSYGLIGRIIKTTSNSSVVKLITSKISQKISVNVVSDTNIYHGIIDNYLIEEDLIRVNNIYKYSDIKIGDKVYTNGLGGIYPGGIYIGDIMSISNDNLDLEKEAFIKLNNNYQSINYVSIIMENTK